MLRTVCASFPNCRPLAQNHSKAVSLYGLFSFCSNPSHHHRYRLLRITSVPCLTVSSLLYVCLTLGLCCRDRVHALSFPAVWFYYLPISKHLWCVIKPCCFTVALLLIISFFAVGCFLVLSGVSLVLIAELRFLVKLQQSSILSGSIFIFYFQLLVGLNHAFIFYTLQFIATH